MIKKSESLKRKKGGRAGKTKTTWRRMKQTPLRKLRLDLVDVEMFGSTRRETHRLKRIDMTVSIIMKV